MTESDLLKDLIEDFQAQKVKVKKQIAIIDPVATSIRKPAATRLFNKSLLILGEITMYILAIIFFGFALFTSKIYLLNTWWKVIEFAEVQDRMMEDDLLWFEMAIKGLLLLLSIAFIWIGRMLSKFRHKNDVLQLAAINMNELVEGLLKRRVEMEQLENQYDEMLNISDEGSIAEKHRDIKFEDLDEDIVDEAINTIKDSNANDKDDPDLLDPNHKDIIL